MVDFERIIEDFIIFKKSQGRYRFYKNQVRQFYVSHLYEIDSKLDEYYEICEDKNKTKKYLLDHPVLKTYLSLELMRKHYEEQQKKYSTSDELNKLGMSALCINKEGLQIYDVENNKYYYCELNDEKFVKYLTIGLQRLNKYIAAIDSDEASVLKVIYMDIQKDERLSKLSKKEICNRMSNELNKARMFDSSFMLLDNNRFFPQNINEEYIKLIFLYKNGLITKEEYYVKYYYYRIISEQNVENLFLNSNKEHKKYIIKAYNILSTYRFDNNMVHIRTTSKLINNEVIKLRKKTDI